MNREEQLVVLGSIALRGAISLLLPEVSKTLQSSILLSTLITSHGSLLEGIFLQEQGLDIYDGGVVHQSPLLIYTMAQLQGTFGLVYPLVDAYISYILIRFAYRLKLKIPAWVIGASYAFNPIAVLSNQAKSSMVFSNACIISALYFGTSGNTSLSAIWISIAAYLSYTPVFLIIPLSKAVAKSGNVLNFVSMVVLTLSVLIGLSYSLTGDWTFIYSQYGTVITFSKIAPNIGLWWYFFTEMFKFFIPFYTAVFSLYNVSFVVPITMKLDGLFAFIMSLGWLNFGKPYPELTDLPLYWSLLLLLQPYFQYLNHVLVYALLFLHSIILAPIFYHLWIDLGSGNSNFFFAINLVYSLAVAATIGDFIWAYLQKKYYDAHQGQENKKVTQI
jgi:phosphatidylinositol glycan class U